MSLRVVDAWIEVETCDLSPAGAGLFSVVEWPIGTPVTFACDVPGRTRPLPLLADGRVAWSEAIPEGTVLGRTGFRCGLEFERLPSRLEDAVTGALLRLETSAWR